MAGIKNILLFFVNYLSFCHCEMSNMIDEDVLQSKDYVFFPNATVPFFIESLHFDTEQALSIMRALANFGFRTCIKFLPVLVRPEGSQHVLIFENPEGIKKCYIDNKGYSIDEPHKVILGYDCLTSPNIDMMIMKNLGFPFEHNRAIRDVFISVQMENVHPSAFELFEKDDKMPKDLRALPYDISSVMHFDTRQFSKNGHRTIIIKNDRAQERVGLTPIDLRKIDTVYGPECRKRDRQDKVELCMNYPGVARKKREAGDQADVEKVTHKVTELPLNDPTVNLRVNRDITPPPEGAADAETKEDVSVSLRELGIEAEVEEVVDHVHQVTALALKNARLKYCNNTKVNLRVGAEIVKTNASDILEIVENIADYATAMVVRAASNLTAFCESSQSIETYQRSCPFFDKSRCPQRYKSTKSGAVKVSTQHRPVMKQSTKHWDLKKKWLRDGNDTKEEQQDSAVTKSALRMGTMVLSGNQRIRYAPNYRSSNDTDDKRHRRRRSVDGVDKNDETTPVVSTNDERAATNDEKVSANEEKVATQDKFANEAKVRNNDHDVESKDVNLINEEKSVKIDNNVLKEASKHPEGVANDKNDKITEVKSGNDENNDVKSNDGPKLVAPSKHDRNRRKAYSSGEIKDVNASRDGVPMQRQNRRLYEDDYEEERVRQKPKRIRERRPRPKEDYYQADEGDQDQEDGNDYQHEREKTEEERPIKKRKKQTTPKSQAYDVDEAGSEEQVKQSKKPRGLKPRTVKLSDKNKEFYGDRRWPSGAVPFIITQDANYDIEAMRARIEEVNSILKEKTCASLQEITEDEAHSYKDYVILDASPDYVTGHVGGKQRFGVLELFEGGQHRQHAAMVVMSMLGFYFEVARHDRDQYVRVHMRHVRPDKLHHFEKIREDATLPLPYDYRSATHPAWQYWRQLGNTGISTVATYKQQDPDGSIMRSMGQNEELLSELDLVKINSVYGTRCFNVSNKRQKARRER